MDYITQFGKIEEAYHQHKLTVGGAHSDFVGTLLNNNPDWIWVIKLPMNLQSLDKGLAAISAESDNFYQIRDIFELDRRWRTYWDTLQSRKVPLEEALYKMLTITIQLLKDIHVRNGQRTDYIYLQKRKSNKDMRMGLRIDIAKPLFNIDGILQHARGY